MPAPRLAIGLPGCGSESGEVFNARFEVFEEWPDLGFGLLQLPAANVQAST